MPHLCPECGAAPPAGQSCQDDFHQMLFWENEYPGHGVVHHLMVLCYYLQHPSLYSPDGLEHARGLLTDFVVRGLTPQDVRRQQRDQVASGNRAWNVTARPGEHGAYPRPPRWTMTARDVVAAGPARYIASVEAWARAAHQSLQEMEAGGKPTTNKH